MSQRGGGPGPDGHELFDELAVGWALHALEPEDEGVFVGHVPGCARCARTVAETTEVMGALAADLPPAEPSEGLRERLRAAVEATEQVQPSAAKSPAAARPAPVAPTAIREASGATGFPGYGSSLRGEADMRSPWRRVVPNALVAAAVAAVLGLGTWNVVLSDARDEAAQQAAEQARVVDSLLEPGTATIAPLSSDGRRVATVVARDTQVQVVTQGLRVNDADSQVYVVWGMTGDGAVAVGTFDVVRSQTDVQTVGSTSTGLDDFGGYAISIEPGREAPAEPSVIVAR